MRHNFGSITAVPFWLGGYADRRTIRLFNEHRRDEPYYADDWDEEDDAGRCWR